MLSSEKNISEYFGETGKEIVRRNLVWILVGQLKNAYSNGVLVTVPATGRVNGWDYIFWVTKI